MSQNEQISHVSDSLTSSDSDGEVVQDFANIYKEDRSPVIPIPGKESSRKSKMKNLVESLTYHNSDNSYHNKLEGNSEGIYLLPNINKCLVKDRDMYTNNLHSTVYSTTKASQDEGLDVSKQCSIQLDAVQISSENNHIVQRKEDSTKETSSGTKNYLIINEGLQNLQHSTLPKEPFDPKGNSLNKNKSLDVLYGSNLFPSLFQSVQKNENKVDFNYNKQDSQDHYNTNIETQNSPLIWAPAGQIMSKKREMGTKQTELFLKKSSVSNASATDNNIDIEETQISQSIFASVKMGRKSNKKPGHENVLRQDCKNVKEDIPLPESKIDNHASLFDHGVQSHDSFLPSSIKSNSHYKENDNGYNRQHLLQKSNQFEKYLLPKEKKSKENTFGDFDCIESNENCLKKNIQKEKTTFINHGHENILSINDNNIVGSSHLPSKSRLKINDAKESHISFENCDQKPNLSQPLLSLNIKCIEGNDISNKDCCEHNEGNLLFSQTSEQSVEEDFEMDLFSIQKRKCQLQFGEKLFSINDKDMEVNETEDGSQRSEKQKQRSEEQKYLQELFDKYIYQISTEKENIYWTDSDLTQNEAYIRQIYSGHKRERSILSQQYSKKGTLPEKNKIKESFDELKKRNNFVIKLANFHKQLKNRLTTNKKLKSCPKGGEPSNGAHAIHSSLYGINEIFENSQSITGSQDLFFDSQDAHSKQINPTLLVEVENLTLATKSKDCDLTSQPSTTVKNKTTENRSDKDEIKSITDKKCGSDVNISKRTSPCENMDFDRSNSMSQIRLGKIYEQARMHEECYSIDNQYNLDLPDTCEFSFSDLESKSPKWLNASIMKMKREKKKQSNKADECVYRSKSVNKIAFTSDYGPKAEIEFHKIDGSKKSSTIKEKEPEGKNKMNILTMRDNCSGMESENQQQKTLSLKSKPSSATLETNCNKTVGPVDGKAKNPVEVGSTKSPILRQNILQPLQSIQIKEYPLQHEKRSFFQPLLQQNKTIDIKTKQTDSQILPSFLPKSNLFSNKTSCIGMNQIKSGYKTYQIDQHKENAHTTHYFPKSVNGSLTTYLKEQESIESKTKTSTHNVKSVLKGKVAGTSQNFGIPTERTTETPKKEESLGEIIKQLHKVKIISQQDLESSLELPDEFWTCDFSKISFNKDFIDKIDAW